jgi:DNA-binding LacI/PurR family transcriptional regulator
LGGAADVVGLELVVPELSNPIFPALAGQVAGLLARRGFTPVLCIGTIDAVSRSDYVDLLLRQQVSGMIFIGGLIGQARRTLDRYALLRQRGLPVVLVNAPGGDPGFARVATDDGHAVEQAYAHLTSLGHRSIGLILGPTEHVPSQRKLRAFQRLVGAADGRVERTVFRIEGARTSANRMVRKGVTGIVCASDILALGAIRAVRRLGLDVPPDVSVVGFDDSAFMSYTDPPLTTVRQPIEALGQAAVARLIDQIEGNVAPAEEMLFEPELVVRGSTGPAPTRHRTGRQSPSSRRSTTT